MYMKQKYSRFSKWILRNIFGTDINVYKRELREHNHIFRKPDSKGWENPEQYIIGSYITLKKIDFELYYESTVWEAMDEDGV